MNRAQKFLTVATLVAFLCILVDYNSQHLHAYFGYRELYDHSVETLARCRIEAIVVTVTYVGLFIALRNYKRAKR